MNLRSLFFIAICMSFLNVGCTGYQPLPNYARSGDTVTFALGREEAQVLVPILKKEEISATITDSSGTTHTARLRHVFRVYADLSSAHNVTGPWIGSYKALWVGVVDLVDPNTNSPLPLATGSATMSVTGNGLDTSGNTSGYGVGDLTSIPIEILQGTGSPHPLNETDGAFFGTIYPVSFTEPMQQVDVAPTTPPSNTVIGGAEFQFLYSYQGAYGVLQPQVVPASQDPRVHLSTRYIKQADGSYLIKSVVVNPTGFRSDNNKPAGESGPGLQSKLRDLSLRVVIRDSGVTDQNWTQALQLISGRYVGMDGATITGMTPVLTKVR